MLMDDVHCDLQLTTVKYANNNEVCNIFCMKDINRNKRNLAVFYLLSD